jgi:peroxiredoxin
VKIIYQTLDLSSKAELEVEDLAALNLRQRQLKDAEIEASHDVLVTIIPCPSRDIPVCYTQVPTRTSVDTSMFAYRFVD